MGATDHEIYKKRGKINIQIGLLLGAFVVFVMIATMARLSVTTDEKMAEQAAEVEATQ